MRRPRDRRAVLTEQEPPADEGLPQAWVPRVLNLMLAAVMLALLGPIVVNFDGKPVYVQAALVMVVLPFLLLTFACLCAAVRPGSLGRALRKGRQRRGSRSTGA